MFIQKIVLNNFRIFRGKHEFDFSNKKVIVIEGPNGHGKSTIFDAINWVISGKISRYVGSSEHLQFNFIINNDALNKGVDEASVEIHLNSSETVCIKRSIKNTGSQKLVVNGQRIAIREGQKEIVRLLVNENITNDANLLESIDLLSFIESTLILSQENLEEFVRGNKPTERYSKLEQILGLTRYGQDFKEYIQDLKKGYVKEYDAVGLEQNKLKHERELLNAQYQPKLLQNERIGSKSKESILNELNTFQGDLKNYSLKPLTTDQNFNDLTKDEYEIVKRYIELIEEELKQLEYFEFEIEKKEIYVDELEINEKIIEYKTDIENLKRNILNREKGLDRADSRIENLNMVSRTNKYLETKKIEKESIITNIKSITENLKTISKNLEINYTNLTFEEISIFEDEFNANNDRLNKLIKKKRILELEGRLNELNKEAGDLEKGFEIEDKLVNDLKTRVQEINESISGLNIQKDSSLSLQINAVIHEVQSHLLDSNEQKCLVCGTDYESDEKLKSAIRIELENSAKFMNEVEISINEHKVKRNKVAGELDLADQKLIDFKQKKQALEKDILILQSEIASMRLSNSIDQEDIKKIHIEIEEVQKYIQSNENKYKGYMEIKEGNTLINDLNQKIYYIGEEEKAATEKHNLYKGFIGDQRNLEIKINAINSYIGHAKNKVQEYNKKVGELEQYIQDSKRKLQLLIRIKLGLEKMLDCELRLNSSDILKFVKENIDLIKNEEYKARNILMQIEKYLGDIELREIETKIKNCDEGISTYQKQLDQYLIMDEQLKSLITYHTEVQSSLINQYLGGLSYTINNYFRQISPHSYFNYINLMTKRNELFVLMNDKELENEVLEGNINESINASLTLSAAQSTILAMSIFLALNKSQNWSKLDVIGIDDPFQNLDDINAYSFIDVIANLILIENRQVIISTHDSDFAKLSIRKMNLKPVDYAYIKIQSYTRDAIEIESEQYRLLGD
ncbi:SMC family ATPase [Peribacillus simplex]|uniref:SMC family ATPase n=1 Tax=Peribacillus simplex TaxID=1478 RepID=UPI002E1A18E5|nr:SMC family ATPase [Peribacillus simplex]